MKKKAIRIPNNDRDECWNPEYLTVPNEDTDENPGDPPVRVIVFADLRPIEIQGKAKG